jgi:hypothetical protein
MAIERLYSAVSGKATRLLHPTVHGYVLFTLYALLSTSTVCVLCVLHTLLSTLPTVNCDIYLYEI